MPGRKKLFITDEDLIQHKKEYHQKYYKANKEKFWPSEKTTGKVNAIATGNAINRIIRDDNSILQLLDKVGHDKILQLMGYEA